MLDDGKTAPLRRGGKEARKAVPTAHGGRYIYLDVDDAFFHEDGVPLDVEFEFLDTGTGNIVLEYDSTDPRAPHDGAFKPAAPVPVEGSEAWKTARVRLDDAAFTERSNGCDFRLSAPSGDLVLHKVLVRKLKAGGG